MERFGGVGTNTLNRFDSAVRVIRDPVVAICSLTILGR